MKQFSLLILFAIAINFANAQYWTTAGNSGLTSTSFLGTTTTNSLVFKTNGIERGRLFSGVAGWRLGTATDFAKIDSAGTLTFNGNGVYKVAGNHYVFQYTTNPTYGLFFNATNLQYEFRNGSAVPVFYVNANNGNSVFSGTVKVGAYTLPAVDGANGQVLKTNGAGGLTWSNASQWLSSGSDIYFNTGFVSVGTPIISERLRVASVDYNEATNIAGFFSNNAAQGIGIGYNTIRSIGSNANSDLKLAAKGSYSVQFYTSNAEQGQFNGVGDLELFGNNNGASTIGALRFGFGSGEAIASKRTAGGNKYGLDFYTGSKNRMSIDSAGNVGIGTSSPSAKLDVNGNINISEGSSLTMAGLGGYKIFTIAVNDNTFIGNNAGYKIPITSSSANTATGSNALYNTTTGNDNTANGSYALNANTTGYANTGIGESALRYNTTGAANLALGYIALIHNISGSYNTAIGADALYNNQTGTGNTVIGADADVSLVNLNNATAIGNNAQVDASNKVVIGSTSVVTIGGYAGWTTYPSDARYKKNVKENVPGLAFINKLKPVTYTADINAIKAKLTADKQTVINTKTDDKKVSEEIKSNDTKAKMILSGFIAQDVEKAAKEIGYNFSGVDAPKNDHDFYGLRYAEFVVPLVKAVQELSKMNDEKTSRLNAQQKEIDELKLIVQQLQQNFNNTSQSSGYSTTVKLEAVNSSSAFIAQNVPNPFSHSTIINYTLPAKYISAKIIITDKAGSIVKEINVSGNGKGNLTVDASTLAAGAYNYSLYVDGKQEGTKQMMHIN